MHTVKDQKGLNDISLARSLDKSHAEQTEHILQTLNCHISTYLHLKTITIIYQLIEKAIDVCWTDYLYYKRTELVTF
jgi:hypothetical protein